MKLTEEYIKENSHWPTEITQQILDDYEKARKWDKVRRGAENMSDMDVVRDFMIYHLMLEYGDDWKLYRDSIDLFTQKYRQNQKLRELLEKKIRKLEKRAEEHHGVGK